MKNLACLGLIAVGCVAGGVAREAFQVPAAQAQAQTLARWQYLCFKELELDAMTAKLNKAGEQGFELVTTAGGGQMATTVCMKRAR